MSSMNTRLNIEKLDGNIVQKHGGSNNLVPVLKQESMEYMMKNVFGLRWNCRELKGIVKLRFFRLVTMILQWLKDGWRTSNLNRRQTWTAWLRSMKRNIRLGGRSRRVFWAEDTTMSTYLVNRSSSLAIGFKTPVDMLGFVGWLASIKQGMLEPVKVKNISFNKSKEYKKTFIGSSVVGSQEVQTQDLIYYHLARDREQHSAWELFGYREDSNEAAFVVSAVDKIYAHESLTFNDTVAYEVIYRWKARLKEDMDARSDVYVLSNDYRKCSDDNDGYYCEYTPGMFIHLFLYIDGMGFPCWCKTEICVTKGLLVKAKENVLDLDIIRDQSGNTLRVSQSRIHNEKLVQSLLKGHSTLSLKNSLSGDCDVENNGKRGLKEGSMAKGTLDRVKI
ncbi:hypothetical protein Tco_1030422 [Tanacetum coccineum]|uniref:Zinc finger, CCHC-type n=1 Tax=Tanacetum coccineum TaxID=301880 RepID=A0ABQ5G6G7_9ASTR